LAQEDVYKLAGVLSVIIILIGVLIVSFSTMVELGASIMTFGGMFMGAVVSRTNRYDKRLRKKGDLAHV
jgi:glucose-6-phosphate-specific signal transduction histidine kinase